MAQTTETRATRAAKRLIRRLSDDFLAALRELERERRMLAESDGRRFLPHPRDRE